MRFPKTGAARAAAVILALAALTPAVARADYGTDYSANAAAVPYGSFVLLATIPATPQRANWLVMNESTGTVQVVFDDGNGANQTSVFLGPASSSPGQGAALGDNVFKGRVRVYGASGATVAVRQQFQ